MDEEEKKTGRPGVRPHDLPQTGRGDTPIPPYYSARHQPRSAAAHSADNMPTTYTIATMPSTGLLIACVPDGADIQAAIAAAEEDGGDTFDRDDLQITTGLTLTDEEQDGDEVMYSGYDLGSLADTDGRMFEYAVRRN